MSDLKSLGFAAIDWIEHYLVHGPGDVQGQRVELDDEFAAFIIKAYSCDPSSGERKIRRAFLSRAKGRSKSGLAAMIECFEALGPCRFDHWAEKGEVSSWGYAYEEGEPVGKPLPYVEILNVATEEGQAGNTYDAVYYMLHPDTCSAELAADYGTIDVGLTRINFPNQRGFAEPVSSADTSKDGGKSTFIVADETHLWVLPRLHRLHGIMNRNLLKRKAASGWMLETSTMYAAGEGSVAEGTHAYASSNARSRSSLLFDHRQASDSLDPSDRVQRIKALREAYGPASAWMNLDGIADSWDDPQVTEAEFRRFWLNQPVPLVAPREGVFSAGAWAACRSELQPGRPTTLGVASDRDVTRLRLAACSEDTIPHLGSVLTTDGRERRQFVAYVADLQTRYGCLVAIDDRGPAEPLVADLEAAGVRLEKADLGAFIQACADMVDAVEARAVTHGGYTDLDAAVAAATWRQIGDRRAFGRKEGDIAMLEAAALALWAKNSGASKAAINNLW